jgi:hypothetical protein
MDCGVAKNTPISHAIALAASEIYVLPTGHAYALEPPARSRCPRRLRARRRADRAFGTARSGLPRRLQQRAPADRRLVPRNARQGKKARAGVANRRCDPLGNIRFRVPTSRSSCGAPAACARPASACSSPTHWPRTVRMTCTLSSTSWTAAVRPRWRCAFWRPSTTRLDRAELAADEDSWRCRALQCRP